MPWNHQVRLRRHNKLEALEVSGQSPDTNIWRLHLAADGVVLHEYGLLSVQPNMLVAAPAPVACHQPCGCDTPPVCPQLTEDPRWLPVTLCGQQWQQPADDVQRLLHAARHLTDLEPNGGRTNHLQGICEECATLFTSLGDALDDPGCVDHPTQPEHACRLCDHPPDDSGRHK